MRSAGLRASGRRYVLDANALLGFFEARQGAAQKICDLFNEARRHDRPLLMSAVTWGEVFYFEWRWHGEAGARRAEAVLKELPIVVIAVDQERASRTGGLKQKHSLGYADAFAAELAMACRLACHGRSGVLQARTGALGFFVAAIREVADLECRYEQRGDDTPDDWPLLSVGCYGLVPLAALGPTANGNDQPRYLRPHGLLPAQRQEILRTLDRLSHLPQQLL